MIANTRTALLAALAAAALAPAAHAATTPNDPHASEQQPLHILRVDEALDRAARPLEDVPVLVLDPGIDRQQPDLESKFAPYPTGAYPPLYNPDPNADRLPAPSGIPGWDLLGTLDPGFNIL